MHTNPYVDCPYNRAHQVPKLRIQHHLVKCRKQHPSSEMRSCPFNATHIMPEPELRWHLGHCPERNLIEGHKYGTLGMNPSHGELGNPAFHHDVPKENWEEPSTSTVHNANQETEPGYWDDAPLRHTRALSPLEDEVQGSSHNTHSLMGLGRGRINLLLSQMNH